MANSLPSRLKIGLIEFRRNSAATANAQSADTDCISSLSLRQINFRRLAIAKTASYIFRVTTNHQAMLIQRGQIRFGDFFTNKFSVMLLNKPLPPRFQLWFQVRPFAKRQRPCPRKSVTCSQQSILILLMKISIRSHALTSSCKITKK